MNAKSRLRRLEQQLQPGLSGYVRDLAAEQAAVRAYLSGEGPYPPDPPCPPAVDPAEHASRLRICRCTLMRGAGEMPENSYVAGMTEAERRVADGYRDAFLIFVRSAADHLPEGNPEYNPDPDQPTPFAA